MTGRSPVDDTAGARDEHLLLVPERRRGGAVLRGRLGGGVRFVLEPEEGALRPLWRRVVGLLDGRGRGSGAALPLLRHGVGRRGLSRKALWRRRRVDACGSCGGGEEGEGLTV